MSLKRFEISKFSASASSKNSAGIRHRDAARPPTIRPAHSVQTREVEKFKSSPNLRNLCQLRSDLDSMTSPFATILPQGLTITQKSIRHEAVHSSCVSCPIYNQLTNGAVIPM